MRMPVPGRPAGLEAMRASVRRERMVCRRVARRRNEAAYPPVSGCAGHRNGYGVNRMCLSNAGGLVSIVSCDGAPHRAW